MGDIDKGIVLKLYKNGKFDPFMARLEWLIESIETIEESNVIMDQLYFKLIEARSYYELTIEEAGENESNS